MVVEGADALGEDAPPPGPVIPNACGELPQELSPSGSRPRKAAAENRKKRPLPFWESKVRAAVCRQ